MPKELLSKVRFKEILDSNAIDQLVGYAENDFFDAKEFFYNFNDPKAAHELCKDVTAFANNDGGYLLIGCRPEKLPDQQIEYIKECVGIADFPNMDPVYSILSEHIYPSSISTLVQFEQIRANDERKFLLIAISGNSSDRPYLVRRNAHDREYVAYYVRAHDRGLRYHIEHLHELAHRGMYFESDLKNIAGVVEKTLSNTEKLLGKSTRGTMHKTSYDIKKDL